MHLTIRPAQTEDAETLVVFRKRLWPPVRPFADGCESRPIPHVEGWYVGGGGELG